MCTLPHYENRRNHSSQESPNPLSLTSLYSSTLNYATKPHSSILPMNGSRWRPHKLHTCRKCHVHGVNTTLKGHIKCPYKDCECVQCLHVSTLRIEAVIRKRRKTLVRLEENQQNSNQPHTKFPIISETRGRSQSWSDGSPVQIIPNNPTIQLQNVMLTMTPNVNSAYENINLQGTPVVELNDLANMVHQDPTSAQLHQLQQCLNLALSTPATPTTTQFPSLELVNLLYWLNYVRLPPSLPTNP